MLEVGDLVTSSKFSGIGKVLGADNDGYEVGFFISPLREYSETVKLQDKDLALSPLFGEAVVYCRDTETGLWRRGRYAGSMPDGRHLVLFRSDGSRGIYSLFDIHCLNVGQGILDPSDFLAARANDAPYFCNLRDGFIQSYIEQRASCRSIGSIISSSVELEPHQIAVVRRVLQDSVQKYLLADEVGLGKTIEAGILIREHVVERKHASRVIVAVPQGLVGQWRDELQRRFHLGEFMAEVSTNLDLIQVCSYEQMRDELAKSSPTMVVVDEAHLVSGWAWSEHGEKGHSYNALSAACQAASSVLLLSGTPLNGNERNYLAMLHLITPETYSLSEEGLKRFKHQIANREKIGSWYGALRPENSNAAIERVLDSMAAELAGDTNLQTKLKALKPLVDFLAEEGGEVRTSALVEVRRYLGENYRLHQRMLRNRRESEELQHLFPGLSGLTPTYMELSVDNVPLDYLLENYRSMALSSERNMLAMSVSSYLKWIEALLTAPLLVGRMANEAIETYGDQLSKEELEILEEIRVRAKVEQSEKDSAFSQKLATWLEEHSEGKAVVFCGDETVARHVFEMLAAELGIHVELYQPGREIRFNNSGSSIRVLICDARGEDGINLHGGRKLAAHYAIPLSFSRVEQRLGRLNRYSANLKNVRPVHSLVVLPREDGLTVRWVRILDSCIGIFSQTVVSLQYVLEEFFSKEWAEVAVHGDTHLDAIAESLTGEEGVIARERRRVKLQEELLSLEQEVIEAKAFAEKLEQVEEDAERQAERMGAWLTHGLHFKVEGSLREKFRLRFVLEEERGELKTLVDVNTLVEKCIGGIDKNSGNPPASNLMSFLRKHTLTSGETYPFRYGQPFVDSIYDLIKGDARGATSAFLRVFDDSARINGLHIFFRMTWLVTGCALEADNVEQRRADEIFEPKIIRHWISDAGNIVEEPSLLAVLNYPYDKATGVRDINLRHSRWRDYENVISADHWSDSVKACRKISRSFVKKEVERSVSEEACPTFSLLAMNAVIICREQDLR